MATTNLQMALSYVIGKATETEAPISLSVMGLGPNFNKYDISYHKKDGNTCVLYEGLGTGKGKMLVSVSTIGLTITQVEHIIEEVLMYNMIKKDDE